MPKVMQLTATLTFTTMRALNKTNTFGASSHQDPTVTLSW